MITKSDIRRRRHTRRFVMFSFHYKFNKYISVYLFNEKFFFDLDEIVPLLRPYFKNKKCRDAVVRMQKSVERYLTPDETLMYIDNFQFGQELEFFILQNVFPVLENYKRTHVEIQ